MICNFFTVRPEWESFFCMWKNIYKTNAFFTLSREENINKTHAFLTLFQNTQKTSARITFLRPRFVREKKQQ